MVRTTEVPVGSEISKHLGGAHLFDAFETSIEDAGKRSALEIYIDVAARTPEWINCLMATRNRLVALFGLKNLGNLNNVDVAKTPDSYRIGDHVGIFSIQFLSDREVILVEADKHLAAKVSLCKVDDGQETKIVMTTAIYIHNLLGHGYMLLVWPLHKLILPALLARSPGQQTHRPR